MIASWQTVFNRARRVALAWASLVLIGVSLTGVVLSHWHEQRFAPVNDDPEVQVIAADDLYLFRATIVVVGGLLVALTYLAVNRKARLSYAVAVRTQELAAVNAALEADIRERQRVEAALRASQNQIRQLLQTTDQGIYGIDLTGCCTFINQAGLTILGYSLEACLGQNMHDLIHHSRADGAPYPVEACPIFRSKASGVGCRLDNEVLWRRDGTAFRAEYSAFPIIEHGEIQGVVVTFSDISERKRLEIALQTAQHHLANAQAISHVGSWSWDLATDTVQWSAEMFRIFGLDPQTFDGKVETVVENSVHPDDRADFRRINQKIIETSETESLEYRIIRPDGSVRHVFADGEFVRDESGQITGQNGIVLDITDREQTEAALRELNATLEQRVAVRTAELQAANLRLTELDHLKDDFLSRTNHELRTPLTSIKIYLELLETAKPDKRDKYLNTVRREADRLQRLIEDLLSITQLSRQPLDLELAESDLNQLLVPRLAVWRDMAARQALEFDVDLADSLPLIRIDPELTVQATVQLINNALNYTVAGAISLQTAARSMPDGQWVIINVTDTGLGIPPDDLPHIFERFYRGRAAADYKTPGTGVGLSISREIVDRMGGRLTVDTQVGVGSTFTLWLSAA